MTAPKLYDCFLYTDQSPYRELLELRLALLRDVVDGFVIVTSRETFAGTVNANNFPYDLDVVAANRDKITVLNLTRLVGNSPRERESYARNRIRDGLSRLSPDDLVMVSDIDEIPRPEVLLRLRQDFRSSDVLVLGLDYFNFKFNYKLIHGLQMVWAGPTVTRFGSMPTPQAIRAARWSNLALSRNLVHAAGWHFSFLATTNGVTDKLESMFSPREKEWRGFADGARSDRRASIDTLIAAREGFHDHMYAGSVWATVHLTDYHCDELAALVKPYDAYLLAEPHDAADDVARRVDLAMWRLYEEEMPKILHHATTKDLSSEVVNRLLIRARRLYQRSRR